MRESLNHFQTVSSRIESNKVISLNKELFRKNMFLVQNSEEFTKLHSTVSNFRLLSFGLAIAFALQKIFIWMKICNSRQRYSSSCIFHFFIKLQNEKQKRYKTTIYKSFSSLWSSLSWVCIGTRAFVTTNAHALFHIKIFDDLCVLACCSALTIFFYCYYYYTFVLCYVLWTSARILRVYVLWV